MSPRARRCAFSLRGSLDRCLLNAAGMGDGLKKVTGQGAQQPRRASTEIRTPANAQQVPKSEEQQIPKSQEQQKLELSRKIDRHMEASLINFQNQALQLHSEPPITHQTQPAAHTEEPQDELL